MNRLPSKQIYLLLVIITGIITLSVYSTYAIFTLESETSDIVNIKTSNVLNIQTNKYEYKQLSVTKNTHISTDIDIYNNFDYELCYAVWYKVISNKKNNVHIYQEGDTLTTNSTIEPHTSRRITLIITNDSDTNAKVNIGVLYAKNEGTCNLNISSDKSLISSTINDIKMLSETIIKDDNKINNISNYLSYENIENEIILPNKINISSSYTYKDEIFTLSNPNLVNTNELNINNNTKYYTCLDNKECNTIYQIKEIKENKMTKYDKLVGYLSGESGLRKINNDYYFYGDNPHNFIYYNCSNELDNKTCELWRIIGLFYNASTNNYLTKIIKNDSIGEYSYSTLSNSWSSSTINNYLNKDYKINNLNIELVKSSLENIIEDNITITEEKNNSEIILMNVSDYLNTSICQNKKINEFDNTCIKNNWLNNGEITAEWTMSIKYETPNNVEETINDTVYSVGADITNKNISAELDIRPAIYLNANTILVDGEGTIDNPYIIR